MRAFIFPGQGSQYPGMAKDWYESNAHAKSMMDKANELLGYKLTEIMFDGDAETLKQTKYTQPAIFLHSIIRFSILNETADAVAGHSLGEFTALVAANALSFEDGLSIVSERGQAMQDSGLANEGSMAAIIGMSDEEVVAICEEAAKIAMVVPANFNANGQIVISGTVAGVEKAIDLAKEKGCRMAKQLPVSGAFHSPLMADALPRLKTALDKATFKTATCNVYANFTALPTKDADLLKQNVIDQLQNPVLWTQTLQNMQNDGVQDFIEIGPGNVLQGLIKRTLKDVTFSGYQ